MEDSTLSEVSFDRNSRREWRPSKPIMLAPLHKWFETFHDGSKEADIIMRERIKARRDELRQRV